jgi:endonuclease VIII
MEGPSLHLAAEQLQPFVGRLIASVSGNSKIGIDRLSGEHVKDIFAWGKHLVFQFDAFALRVHFMLWGTFAATVDGTSVTGDYRRAGPPRLVLNFPNGEITMWAASVKFVDESDAKASYDFTADIMADQWDSRAALRKVRAFSRSEIADVLLDQAIFAGVGNIIKNEVLFRTRTSPFAAIKHIPDRKLRKIVADARVFSFRFLELRKVFALRKNLEVYRRGSCPRCGGKIHRKVHGQRARRSFFCPRCQQVPPRYLSAAAEPARLTRPSASAVGVRARRVSGASPPAAASRARDRRAAARRSDTRGSS